MIEKVVENVAGSEVFRTLVVVGSFRDEISGVISHTAVSSCYNENYRNGMLSSVKCGFKNLPALYDAVLVFPGDQPFIEPDVINSLIKLTGRPEKELSSRFTGKKGGIPY